MAVLDFDSFPSVPQEQSSLVRFRVKKSVRADLDKASVSYYVQAHLSGGKKKDVVIAVLSLEILARYEDAGLAKHDTHIVGCNANAGNPHYEPVSGHSASIQAGDWVLLDMWAKEKSEGAVYYDITWCGFAGETAPERHQTVFHVVREARDSAVAFVQDAMKAGRPLQGWQVDDVARGVIAKAGYGNYFTHRTGHSIAVEIHANGANMDNLETRDERRIVPWTCFSIEPGIYLPEFGVRLEVDVFVDDKPAHVTGAIQKDIVRIEV